MADQIGTIFVELAANTGQFVSSLGQASAQARRAGREISDSFSSLGEVAATALAPFGKIGDAIAETLGKAGSFSSAAITQFSKMAGGLTGMSVAGGVAVGALAAVEGGALALAVSTAETADHFLTLSQSTGVAVETLSGLSGLAKLSGLSIDELALSLDRMNKSAFASATAPAGTITAYTRLGVAVRDANGQMRPTIDILEDIADKFSKMADSAEKGALAQLLFGRAGAGMISFLDEGKEKFAEFIEYSNKVGATLTTATAQGAHQFEENLVKLQLAGQGLANQLTTELLPSLIAVTEQLGNEFANKDSDLHSFIDSVVFLTKVTATFAELAIYSFGEVGSVIRHAAAEVLLLVDAMNSLPSAAKTVAGIAAAPVTGGASLGLLDENSKANVEDLLRHDEDSRKSVGDVLNKIWGPAFSAKPGAGAGGLTNQPAAPTSTGRTDIVDETIAKLQAEAKARLDVAAATDRSTGALVLAEAAAKAEQTITDLQTRLLERQKALRAQLASEQGAGQGPEAARTGAGLAEVEKQLNELAARSPEIKTLLTESFAGSFAGDALQNVQKFIDKENETAAAARTMTAAYEAGGPALAAALDSEKLEEFKRQLQAIGTILEGLKAVGAPGDVTAKYQTIYSQLAQQIDLGQQAQQASRTAAIGESIAKETDALRHEADAYRILGEAAFASAAAQREAAARVAGIRFKAENPAATDKQVDTVVTIERTKQTEDYDQTVNQKAAEEELDLTYQKRVVFLEDVRSKLEEVAASSEYSSEQQQSAIRAVIAVDNELAKTQTELITNYQKQAFDAANSELEQNATLYESQRSLEEQWIRMADEAGTFGDKIKGVFAGIALDGQDAANSIFNSFRTAVGGISDQLASIAVTGKGDLGQVFTSLEKNIVASGIKGAFGNLAGEAEKIFPGLKIPGLEKKPTGSHGDPFHVIVDGGLDFSKLGTGTGGSNVISEASQRLERLLGAPGTATTPPFLPGDVITNSTTLPTPAESGASISAAVAAAPTFGELPRLPQIVGAPFPATPAQFVSPPTFGAPFPATPPAFISNVITGSTAPRPVPLPGASISSAIAAAPTFGAPLPATPPEYAAAEEVEGAPLPATPPEFGTLPFTHAYDQTAIDEAIAPQFTTASIPAAAAAAPPTLTTPNPYTSLFSTVPSIAALAVEASGASRGAKIIAPIAATLISALPKLFGFGGPSRSGGTTSATATGSPLAAAGGPFEALAQLFNPQKHYLAPYPATPPEFGDLPITPQGLASGSSVDLGDVFSQGGDVSTSTSASSLGDVFQGGTNPVTSVSTPAAAGFGAASIIGAVLGAGAKGATSSTGIGAAGTAANPLYVIELGGAAGGGAGGPANPSGGIAAAASKIFGIGGGGGASGGSSPSNPLYVKDVGGTGSGSGGGLGSLFGGSDGGSDDGGFSSLFDGAGGAADSGGSDFSDLFAGGLAAGGDMTPGQLYLTGEKGPEFIFAKQPSTVAPTLKFQSPDGGQQTNVYHMHINGVTDADSFKRSSSQIFAEAHRQMTIARGRNG